MRCGQGSGSRSRKAGERGARRRVGEGCPIFCSWPGTSNASGLRVREPGFSELSRRWGGFRSGSGSVTLDLWPTDLPNPRTATERTRRAGEGCAPFLGLLCSFKAGPSYPIFTPPPTSDLLGNFGPPFTPSSKNGLKDDSPTPNPPHHAPPIV